MNVVNHDRQIQDNIVVVEPCHHGGKGGDKWAEMYWVCKLSFTFFCHSFFLSLPPLSFSISVFIFAAAWDLCHTYPRAPEAPTHRVAGFDLGLIYIFPTQLVRMLCSLSLSLSELKKSVCVCVREMSKE